MIRAIIWLTGLGLMLFITPVFSVSQLNGLLAIYIHSMSKDGMSKDGRKMPTVHVTLKADVSVIISA